MGFCVLGDGGYKDGTVQSAVSRVNLFLADCFDRCVSIPNGGSEFFIQRVLVREVSCLDCILGVVGFQGAILGMDDVLFW
jgi:hypothetical protein